MADVIASRLVLHHTYDRGVAFDLSENGNHGVRTAADLGGGYTSAIQFNGGPSAIRVAPSPSLQNLRAVRAQAVFRYEPSIPGDRRHNLVEGHDAFALFIHPDASLLGTILNHDDQWVGAQSAAGVVQIGQWHTAEFVHDGIAHSSLYLDGKLVGEGFSSPGPVRSVSYDGVAIGHWPGPSDLYTLEGYIDEVRVWCNDPVADVGQLIDDCCIDREAIDRNHDKLREAGIDSTVLGNIGAELLDIGRQGASWLARGSAFERDHALDLAGRFLLAYETSDYASLLNTASQAASLLQARAPAPVLDDLKARLQSVLAPLPPTAEIARVEGDDRDREPLVSWLEPWCLDDKLPPPRHSRREEPPRGEDLSRDPHTDVPPNERPDDDPTEHEDVPPPPPPPEHDEDGDGDVR